MVLMMVVLLTIMMRRLMVGLVTGGRPSPAKYLAAAAKLPELDR